MLLAGSLLAVPAPVGSQSQASRRAESLIRDAQGALKAEDYRAAERYYKAAVAADRGSPDASCGLGQVYMALRQFEEAVGALRNCKKYVLTQLRKLQSDQTRSQSRIDGEIRELRDTLQAIQSGYIRSAGADRAQRIESRITELERMRSRDPVGVELPPEISFALGTALLQIGALPEAEQELLDVTRSKARAGDAHNNLATVYLAQGRFAEATEQVRLAEEAGVRVSPQLKVDIEFRNRPDIAPSAPVELERDPTASEPVSIEHVARTCAVKGHFVNVEATVRPAWGIYDPVVRFRTEGEGGWYSTVMLPAGEDSVAAVLPKPRSAQSFEYFIKVSDYQNKETRTDSFPVSVEGDPTACAEAAADPDRVASVLIIDTPTNVPGAPPVPPGFSIRGTTADAGVLEMGSSKALVAGGLALGAAVAGGVAWANNSDLSYKGPKPFVEAPGIAFVMSEPPPGSTLSLSGGEIVMQLHVYSPQAITGARIAGELAIGGFSSGCLTLQGVQDLAAARTETVVIRGTTQPLGGASCDTRVPLSELRVRVVEANGLGGFRTGLAPLVHLRVTYHVTN